MLSPGNPEGTAGNEAQLPTLASHSLLTLTDAQPLLEQGRSACQLVCLPSLCLGVSLKKRLVFHGMVAPQTLP